MPALSPSGQCFTSCTPSSSFLTVSTLDADQEGLTITPVQNPFFPLMWGRAVEDRGGRCPLLGLSVWLAGMEPWAYIPLLLGLLPRNQTGYRHLSSFLPHLRSRPKCSRQEL